jgi:hypothetical protein
LQDVCINCNNLIGMFTPYTCATGFSALTGEQHTLFRGKALSVIDTANEIDLVAAVLKASSLQVAQMIKNVTDKATKQLFNKAGDKWWKVTMVEGPQVGEVGWIMKDLLSDDKIK